jgi:ATP-dependent helicase/DNAse subunit B
MFSLVKELKQICTAFPFKEKVVIVDSHNIGEQMNEAFVKAGNQAVNLKYSTVFDLAHNLVELNSTKPLHILDHNVGIHLTYSLLNSMKQQGRLRYFSGMEVTPSFSQKMYSSIQTLRLADYTSNTLYRAAFISAEKADDMVEILAGYEAMIRDYQFIDKAGLLKNAIQFALTDEAKVYILQSNLSLTSLEEQLLEKVLPANKFKLPVAPVFGVNIPERTSLRSISFGDPTPLSYLYQQENASGGADISIFTAKTEELEVKQILQSIKSERTPLDENVVYYSNGDAYVTLFYHLSHKMNIPVTFGEGLPVLFSSPGRLVSGVIAWMQNNYSAQGLIDLVNEGLLYFDDEAPSKSRMAKALRDLQIGWSQERYVKQLTAALEALDADDAYYESKLSELSWLNKWFSSLFKKLPPYTLTLNYKHCLTGIAYFLKNHGKTSSALDEISKSAILEEIERILPYADETLSSYDAFEKLNDLLLSITVNQSRPKPGHLHVTSYKRGAYNSRQHVFLVGLDNKKFPGNVSEDPLLLDAERSGLNRNLPLLSNKGQENLYLLLQVLAQSAGKVTVSYCDFDINENRVVNPAFVVLQCYRMMTGDREAEFKSLKNLPTTIIADDIFDDKDYWNEKLTSDVPVAISDEILNHFENVKYGLTAETARHRTETSEYEGRVQIDASEYDPRLNHAKKLSAGKLETLAKCPYSYFLKEVLRIKPIEEIAFDANKWLDPATRGSLLHSIFETFYKQLTAENAKPVYALHLDKLLALAIDLTQQQKEVLPPPNDRIYLRELNDILECCKIFLKEEERHSEDYNALEFEYSFGIGGKEPAVIKLPSGEFKLSGIIDRVDRSGNGRYHIIDYKTGSSYGYSKNGAFKGGRQLQHMVYALAIEQHLQLGEGAVVESAYYFPTVKGMAEKFVRKQDAALRTNGLSILEQLIDIIKHGHFEMTDDENDCKFCELKLICRRHLYDKEMLEMKQSNQKLKGVRAYD